MFNIYNLSKPFSSILKGFARIGGHYIELVTLNLAFLHFSGFKSVLPYIKTHLSTFTSSWHSKINPPSEILVLKLFKGCF